MWKEYETLLGLCDFVIANRPGIRLEALRLVIPPDLHGRRDAKREKEEESVAHGSPIVARLDKTTVDLLENVATEVSATDIRREASRGPSIDGVASGRGEELILNESLDRREPQ